MNDTIKVCIIEDDEKYHKIVKDLLKKYGMKSNGLYQIENSKSYLFCVFR